MSEIKLVLVGLGGVGKSAVTIAYVTNVFVPEYDPTIEDSHRKQVQIDDEANILDILDTAGQEEYATMQDQWFRTGKGFLVVYSITSKRSFDEVRALRTKIVRLKDDDKVPMVLIGNKCDLESQRVVPKAQAEKLAKEFNIPFFETSAKEDINITECFEALVREVRKHDKAGSAPEKEGESATTNDQKKSTDSSSDSSGKKKKKGCLLL